MAWHLSVLQRSLRASLLSLSPTPEIGGWIHVNRLGSFQLPLKARRTAATPKTLENTSFAAFWMQRAPDSRLARVDAENA